MLPPNSSWPSLLSFSFKKRRSITFSSSVSGTRSCYNLTMALALQASLSLCWVCSPGFGRSGHSCRVQEPWRGPAAVSGRAASTYSADLCPSPAVLSAAHSLLGVCPLAVPQKPFLGFSWHFLFCKAQLILVVRLSCSCSWSFAALELLFS